MRGFLRRLRGAIGNAVVWGVSWFGVSFALLTTGYLAGAVFPMADPWRLILLVATSSGVSGFLTGGLFSGYLGVVYRDRPLLGIRKSRFALGGALVAGLSSALVSVGTGSFAGFPIGFIAVSVVQTAVFGGITAGVTIAMAQRAARIAVGGAERELEAEQAEVRALLEG